MKGGNRWFSRILSGVILAGMLGVAAGLPRAAASEITPAAQQETKENGKEEVLNILLIGRDGTQSEELSRSDCMILCSFHEGREELIMSSILRDLYVPIPGHGANRINAAYAFGGAQLLKETLEKNFDLEIDGTVEVDFSQFCRIIDVLGGVTVTLRQDEAKLLNRETGSMLTAGEHTLSGDQALAYTRIRSLDANGDFSRTGRQRRILEAVWNRYKNSSFPTLIRTMGSLIPMIRTDMGSGELLTAAVGIFPYLKNIQVVSQSVPAADMCKDRVIDGMAVLTADLEEVKAALHSRIQKG